MNNLQSEQKKLGRPFKYLPDQLQNKVDEYKEWAQKQTFSKVIYDQKAGEQKTIELKMPLTVHQFCLFIGIQRQTFYDIMNNVREINNTDSVEINKQLSDILTCVHEYIQANQISGAILNEYNPTIVARLNGINETINVDQQISIAPTKINIGSNVIDLTDKDYSILTE